jgi:hypothetical protein
LLKTQNFNICVYTKNDFSLRRLDMTGYHAGLDDEDEDFGDGPEDDEGYEPDWDDEDEEWNEGEDDFDLDPDDEEE